MSLKNTINLNTITQQELNSVKEIAGLHMSMSGKFQQYSNQVQDQQLKQMLQQQGQDAKETATNLINSL